MTEKRFKLKDIGFVYDNNTLIGMYEIVNCLNTLNDENERLKEYNNKLMKQPLLFGIQTIPNTMEIMEINAKLEKENEQLKSEINMLKTTIGRNETYIKRLTHKGEWR